MGKFNESIIIELLEDVQCRLARVEEILSSSETKIKISPKLERIGNFKLSKIQAIKEAYKECGGNQALTCRQLGISRSTLYRALKEDK